MSLSCLSTGQPWYVHLSSSVCVLLTSVDNWLPSGIGSSTWWWSSERIGDGCDPWDRYWQTRVCAFSGFRNLQWAQSKTKQSCVLVVKKFSGKRLTFSCHCFYFGLCTIMGPSRASLSSLQDCLWTCPHLVRFFSDFLVPFSPPCLCATHLTKEDKANMLFIFLPRLESCPQNPKPPLWRQSYVAFRLLLQHPIVNQLFCATLF